MEFHRFEYKLMHYDLSENYYIMIQVKLLVICWLYFILQK